MRGWPGALAIERAVALSGALAESNGQRGGRDASTPPTRSLRDTHVMALPTSESRPEARSLPCVILMESHDEESLTSPQVAKRSLRDTHVMALPTSESRRKPAPSPCVILRESHDEESLTSPQVAKRSPRDTTSPPHLKPRMASPHKREQAGVRPAPSDCCATAVRDKACPMD